MSWITLPAPGERLGPCEDAACGHQDCMWTRQIAGFACYYCGEVLGYGRQITRDYVEGEYLWVHLWCAMQGAERERVEREREAG